MWGALRVLMAYGWPQTQLKFMHPYHNSQNSYFLLSLLIWFSRFIICFFSTLLVPWRIPRVFLGFDVSTLRLKLTWVQESTETVEMNAFFTGDVAASSLSTNFPNTPIPSSTSHNTNTSTPTNTTASMPYRKFIIQTSSTYFTTWKLSPLTNISPCRCRREIK